MPALHRLLGQMRPLDQHLERDHGAAMQLEGIEVVAEVLRDVGKPIGIEQREHLVIFPPQLAEPLDGQRVRRHHQAALDLAGVDEPIENQRRLDRFAEADLVGEQPAHGIAARSRARRRRAGAGRAERGRRGTVPGRRLRESRAGAGCSCASRSRRHRRGRPRRGVRAARLRAPAAITRRLLRCGRLPAPTSRRELNRHGGFFSGRGDADRPSGAQIDRDQRIGVGGQPKVVAERGNSTTRARRSTALMRPIPSSGLNWWVR